MYSRESKIFVKGVDFIRTSLYNLRNTNQRRIQRRRFGRAPPCLKFFGCVFENFDSVTRINSIVINMQYLQYVFYSIHYKSIGYVWKGFKTSSDLKNFAAPDLPPPPPRFLNYCKPPTSSAELTFNDDIQESRDSCKVDALDTPR